MTVYNFTVQKGTTFNGSVFTLSTCIGIDKLANFPAVGVAGEIYKDLSTSKKYKWVSTAYVETTDKKYIDLTGASIKCDFEPIGSKCAVLSMTQTSGITITNASSGVLQFNSQVIDIAVGVYEYDMLFTFSSGAKKVYISGRMTITDNQSD
jgi:hypothetical protein